jgi:hypothetical protein
MKLPNFIRASLEPEPANGVVCPERNPSWAALQRKSFNRYGLDAVTLELLLVIYYNSLRLIPDNFSIRCHN